MVATKVSFCWRWEFWNLDIRGWKCVGLGRWTMADDVWRPSRFLRTVKTKIGKLSF